MAKYEIGQKKIENILDRNGISRISNSDRALLKSQNYKYTVAEIKEKVIDNYVNKEMGQIASGREFGLAGATVRNILVDAGIPIRSYGEAQKLANQNRRSYSSNKEYFQIETPNMAWLLGFLAQDGSIAKKGNTIKLSLSAIDIDVLYAIKEEIEIEAPITRYVTNKGYEVASLTWTSQYHKRDLANYGIIPQKTFQLELPLKLDEKFWIDYIRGYFDGDGSVSTAGPALRWQICSATTPILVFIMDELEKRGIQKVSIQKWTKSRLNPTYVIQYSTQPTRDIYNFLYTPNSLYLPRKKEKYEKLLADK